MNGIANFMCSIRYETCETDQGKQLNVFDIRNHRDSFFLLRLTLVSTLYRGHLKLAS